MLWTRSRLTSIWGYCKIWYTWKMGVEDVIKFVNKISKILSNIIKWRWYSRCISIYRVAEELEASEQCECIFHSRVSQLKICDFSGENLKVLKCYNFLWVHRRHNCSPAASFANSVMTLYLLKVHLQTFLSIPITQKCQILICDTLVANALYIYIYRSGCTRYI